jgi:PERQ amino acid-rich with GYF domain-containing protein
MHFGPEWMRTKHQPPSRTQPPPSPPPVLAVPPSASTYSALVSPALTVQVEKRDEAHPFRYSKEELLRIYGEGGGRGGLGLEVERWEGVVREVGSEPVALREMSEAEKKVKAYPYIRLVAYTYVPSSYSQALSIPTCVDDNLLILSLLSPPRPMVENGPD